MILELIGHLGALFLSICAFPQLYTTLKTKDVTGLSLFSLFTWAAGCFLMLIYVFFTGGHVPLLINYGVNSFIVSSIVFLYFRYKKGV